MKSIQAKTNKTFNTFFVALALSLGLFAAACGGGGGGGDTNVTQNDPNDVDEKTNGFTESTVAVDQEVVNGMLGAVGTSLGVTKQTNELGTSLGTKFSDSGASHSSLPMLHGFFKKGAKHSMNPAVAKVLNFVELRMGLVRTGNVHNLAGANPLHKSLVSYAAQDLTCESGSGTIDGIDLTGESATNCNDNDCTISLSFNDCVTTDSGSGDTSTLDGDFDITLQTNIVIDSEGNVEQQDETTASIVFAFNDFTSHTESAESAGEVFCSLDGSMTMASAITLDGDNATSLFGITTNDFVGGCTDTDDVSTKSGVSFLTTDGDGDKFDLPDLKAALVAKGSVDENTVGEDTVKIPNLSCPDSIIFVIEASEGTIFPNAQNALSSDLFFAAKAENEGCQNSFFEIKYAWLKDDDTIVVYGESGDGKLVVYGTKGDVTTEDFEVAFTNTSGDFTYAATPVSGSADDFGDDCDDCGDYEIDWENI